MQCTSTRLPGSRVWIDPELPNLAGGVLEILFEKYYTILTLIFFFRTPWAKVISISIVGLLVHVVPVMSVGSSCYHQSTSLSLFPVFCFFLLAPTRSSTVDDP